MKQKHFFVKCRQCGEHLYEGDSAYKINDSYFCPCCIRSAEIILPDPDITPEPDCDTLRRHWQTTALTFPK